MAPWKGNEISNNTTQLLSHKQISSKQQAPAACALAFQRHLQTGVMLSFKIKHSEVTEMKGTACLTSFIISCRFHMTTTYKTPVWEAKGPWVKMCVRAGSSTSILRNRPSRLFSPSINNI